jgi:predicted enzyme related to lactoylglutathione lyase
MNIGITIDVPDLATGLAFYGSVFGFTEVARPHPAYAVIAQGDQRLGLIAKAAGTTPAPDAAPRTYARHWTPVHLDFHVTDLPATLTAVAANGGTVEEQHAAPGRPGVAFCADPFGHGFCILGPRG